MSFKYYDVSLRRRRHRRHSLWWFWPYLAGLASGVVLVVSLLS